MPAAKFQIIRKCPICGSEFLAKTIESLYCSPKCSKTAWKRKHDEKLRLEKMDEAVKDIPESKEMITVPEAYLQSTLIRKKKQWSGVAIWQRGKD